MSSQLSLTYAQSDYEKEFLAFEKSISNEYIDFEKSIHEEFSKMLKKNWEEFYSKQAPNPYVEPKPKVLPIVKNEKKIIEKVASPLVKIKKTVLKKKPKSKPIVKKEIPQIPYGFDRYSVKFYSQEIGFLIDTQSKFGLDKVSANSIRKFYSHFSKTKYKGLLEDIEKESLKLNLNDWAKYQLIYKLGMELYSNENLANLFSWFLLNELGFDSRIAYSNEEIYLLATIEHQLFQVSFITKNSKKYYILTPSGRNSPTASMYTYQGEHPSSSKKLSFFMNKKISLTKNIEDKELSFKYYNVNYKIKASYSKDLIDFYKTYPQSDFNVYFNSENSTSVSSSILEELKPLLVDKSELEAANFLLRFVQKAFKYRTDPKQFGYEKPLFVEETIFYPYSDCEDRSILFSYLVRSLLGLDVVGIHYEGHLATAVAFNSKVEGDSFTQDGRVYTIADPTYINANIGMTMKQYANTDFQVINLK